MRVFIHLTLVLFMTVLATVSNEAQSKALKIDELLTKYNELGHLEGSVLVAESGKVVFKRGFGLANREWNIPNAPNTKYDVGSLTKSFTAILTMQLVEKGLIKLDGKVTDYLPNYRKDTGSRVTIHHLLSHTSGLPGFWTFEFFKTHARNDFEEDYFIRTFLSEDLEFAPGTSSRYSDTNYYLLGRIIEKVLGKPYAQVKTDNLFKPLGMKNSEYNDQSKVIPNRASGYIKTSRGYSTSPYNNRRLTDAAGASLTTVEDLYLYDRALYSDALLSKTYRDMLFKSYAEAQLGPQTVRFGYGWIISEMTVGDRSVPYVHAGGNNAGFSTVIYRIPSNRHFIAILANAGPDYFNERLHEVSRKLVSILYDQPYELPKPSISKVLRKTIERHGFAAGLDAFQKLKTKGAHEIREGDLNSIGYWLLRTMKVKDAIVIFRLNVKEFPTSFNVYDSLADAYLTAGEKRLAIANYEKSLRLNPNNRNAITQLQKLKTQ